MACFGLGWLEQLCIWLIIVFAVIAIICVKILFMLFGCLLEGPGSLHLMH